MCCGTSAYTLKFGKGALQTSCTQYFRELIETPVSINTVVTVNTVS